jgi:mRNA interferase MazF
MPLVRPILTTPNPRLKVARNEVWLVNFDPTVGDEIQKTRPAVVISVNAAFRHRLQIVVPITSWQQRFQNDFWMIYLPASSANGLANDSAANAFQIKSISEDRFVRKIGLLDTVVMDDITTAVALCIGYNPQI